MRGVQAGYGPGAVAAYAREEFGVDDPDGRLEEEYQAAADQRLADAGTWLDEHGSRPDDDQQEDSRAATVTQFGIHPKDAKVLVDDYDKGQRAATVESVNGMDDGLPPVRQTQQVMETWGDTRYIDDALDALWERQEREKQERETQQRGRGGHSLGW